MRLRTSPVALTLFASVAMLVTVAPPATAQCVPYGTAGPGPDYVYIHADASMNAQSTTAVANSVASWRGACYQYGQQMGFPIPSSVPVSGASFASLTVTYQTGFKSTNPNACGDFVGNTITVYEKAMDPNGNTIMCSTFGYDWIIMHEIGHFYGLADLSGSCPSIMGQLDGSPSSISGDDCATADALKDVPSEHNTVYPTCSEPCAGTCSSDGICEATRFDTSPILVPLGGNRFALTGLSDPVSFDIDADGESEVIGWTAAGMETAFLVLDRNGNGRIDDGSELFGNNTPLPDGSTAPDGFVGLAPFDSLDHGGNGDLRLDAEDVMFASLSIWTDVDHDGETDPRELASLADHGIVAISLESELQRRTDRHGNRFGLRGSALRMVPKGNATRPLLLYDIAFIGE